MEATRLAQSKTTHQHRQTYNDNDINKRLTNASRRNALPLPVRRRISVRLAAHTRTPAHTDRQRIGLYYVLVYRALCLFTPQLSLDTQFHLLTEVWLRLSIDSAYLVLRRGGFPVQRRSPIQALTWPGVE